MSDKELDSIKLLEGDDRWMNVNDLVNGGLGFVLWNSDVKNVIRITREEKLKLLAFIYGSIDENDYV